MFDKLLKRLHGEIKLSNHYNKLIFLFVVKILVLSTFNLPAQKNIKTHPLIRLKDSVSNLTLSPHGKYLSFFDDFNGSLKVLDIQTQKVYLVSNEQGLDRETVWAPHGHRLFYGRSKSLNKKLSYEIKAYDCGNYKNILVESVEQPLSYLTFSPFEKRFYFLTQKGVSGFKLLYPGNSSKNYLLNQSVQGSWIVANKKIFWLKNKGRSLTEIWKGPYEIASFDISSSGRKITWTDENNHVYISNAGKTPVFIGIGKDPTWHSSEEKILYSSGRRNSGDTINYDLKVMYLTGKSSWLTSTDYLNERWPRWYSDQNKIIYTKEKTTDIFLLTFEKI